MTRDKRKKTIVILNITVLLFYFQSWEAVRVETQGFHPKAYWMEPSST